MNREHLLITAQADPCFETQPCAHAGVIDVLTEALKDKNERVRRRIMATLGELLFYVATQQQVHRHAPSTSPASAVAASDCDRAYANPSQGGVIWVSLHTN